MLESPLPLLQSGWSSRALGSNPKRGTRTPSQFWRVSVPYFLIHQGSAPWERIHGTGIKTVSNSQNVLIPLLLRWRLGHWLPMDHQQGLAECGNLEERLCWASIIVPKVLIRRQKICKILLMIKYSCTAWRHSWSKIWGLTLMPRLANCLWIKQNR